MWTYTEFTRFYEYASSLERRFSYPFELIVISLTPPANEEYSDREMEKSMFYMEQAIKQTIREVDIMTRYGTSHFLVILLGADQKGAQIASDRIFRNYYKMSGSGAYLPGATEGCHGDCHGDGSFGTF